MDANEYLDRPYNCIVKRIDDESGSYYSASVLELDGCRSTGATYQEAYDSLSEAMECWIEAKLEAGMPIPDPLDDSRYSGRYVVRLPKSLHRKLAIEAKNEGVSLNQYTLFKLSV